MRCAKHTCRSNSRIENISKQMGVEFAGKFLLQDAWQASEKQATSAERKYQRRLIGRINQRISMARNDKQPDKPFHKRHIDR